MVAMTPEAITARLVRLAEASRALGDAAGPQAVAMTPEAITARLREWAELTALCLRLGRETTLLGP